MTTKTFRLSEKEETKLILFKYKNLLSKASLYYRLSSQEVAAIREGFKFALDAHKNDRRKSGEPYILHPIEVASICAEDFYMDKTGIIAALLHDVVEDTQYELKDIEERFGPKVAFIIDGLTKISTSATKNVGNLQLESFKKMLINVSQDPRVILIKIADRLHNMRTLDSMPRHKQFRIKSETELLYAPIAYRLGLYKVKSELEDLCFKYTNPEMYAQIQHKIESSEKEREAFIKKFVTPICAALDKDKISYEVKGRVKSVWSIYQKMVKQGVDFEEIFDVFAVRFIIDGVEREEEKAICWKAYSIVTDYYTPNTERLRDWIGQPRNNGYESLHTTVMSPQGKWVEVQIRTRRMDDIAEKGFAAHFNYKKGAKNNNLKTSESGLDAWFNSLRETLENKNLDTFDFIDDFTKDQLNQNEILVYTHKGEIRQLPENASVLDFAFDIHSELGAHCIGAKVNNKTVPIHYRLKNGDQIEILTSKKSNCNSKWMEYVVTSKAKNHIRRIYRKEINLGAEYGKEIIYRKLNQLKIEPSSSVLLKLVKHFGLENEMELFYKVGIGEIEHNLIKGFQKGNEVASDEISIVKEVKNAYQKRFNGDVIYIGDQMSGIDYKLMECCNPIAGEDIVGFVSVDKGLRVHKTSCPNAIAQSLKYPYRLIDVEWVKQSNAEFTVKLRIDGTDRIGLVQDVTKLISQRLKLNIQAINISTESGIFRGEITLLLHDISELNQMIAKLKSTSGIINVLRI
jgi:GTP pyrophosphokinase